MIMRMFLGYHHRCPRDVAGTLNTSMTCSTTLSDRRSQLTWGGIGWRLGVFVTAQHVVSLSQRRGRSTVLVTAGILGQQVAPYALDWPGGRHYLEVRAGVDALLALHGRTPAV